MSSSVLDDLDGYYLPKIDPKFISIYGSVKSKINSNHEVRLTNIDHDSIRMIKRSISVLFSLATNKRMNIQFFTYQINHDVDPELLKSLKFFINAINLTLSMFDNLINVVLII
jgi:hypothetical protein